MLPAVSPWPLASLPWGLTGDYAKLGVSMVIDNPLKWEGPKIVLAGGTKAIFKFVHKAGPIMTSVHLYDHEGNELVEEGGGHGHGTLYFLSRQHAMNSAELRMKIESGVSVLVCVALTSLLITSLIIRR